MVDVNSNVDDSNTENNPRRKTLGMIVLGSVVAIATLVALAPLWGLLLFSLAMSIEEEYQSISSPKGTYEIQIHYTSPFIYGPHGIIVRAKDGRKTLAKYETTLSNDGANLYEDNIQVDWHSDTLAYICIRGQEQEPAGIALELEMQHGQRPKPKAMFSTNPQGCTF